MLMFNKPIKQLTKSPIKLLTYDNGPFGFVLVEDRSALNTVQGDDLIMVKPPLERK